MRPADIAVELRPRSSWEAIDLGLAMLQRWWRSVYLPHAMVIAVVAAPAAALGAWLGKPWIALLVLWWLKPLYDRVALHVLSHAVFGELPGIRSVIRAARRWLGSGLLPYLLFRWWPDLARSFALPAAHGRMSFPGEALASVRAAAGRLNEGTFVPLVRFPDRLG